MGNRETQAAFKARMRDRGFIQVNEWIPASEREAFKQFAKDLRERHEKAGNHLVTSKPATPPRQDAEPATPSHREVTVQIQAPDQSTARTPKVLVTEETLFVPAIGYAQLPEGVTAPPKAVEIDPVDATIAAAIAHEFKLPADFAPQQIDNFLNSIPQTRANKTKLNRAMRSVMKSAMEDRKRMNLEKLAGYAVLREPTNFGGNVG